jgi:hypothetical protein
VSRANVRRWALTAAAAVLGPLASAPDAAASPGEMKDLRYEVSRDPLPGDPPVAKGTPDPPATPRFGERGQIVLSADLDLRVGAVWSDGDDPRSSVHFAVSPSFDAFVADDLTLGAFASYGATTSRAFGPEGSLNDYATTSGALGGRIGFNAPLGRWLSWWPRISLAWSESNSVATVVTPAAQATGGGYDYTQSGFYVFVQAPLLVHPAPHWFLGVGPTFYRDLSRSLKDSPATNNRTTIGFAYAVGGYF